jgi:hypothetical protein
VVAGLHSLTSLPPLQYAEVGPFGDPTAASDGHAGSQLAISDLRKQGGRSKVKDHGNKFTFLRKRINGSESIQ